MIIASNVYLKIAVLGWGCGLVDRVLLKYAQGAGFRP